MSFILFLSKKNAFVPKKNRFDRLTRMAQISLDFWQQTLVSFFNNALQKPKFVLLLFIATTLISVGFCTKLRLLLSVNDYVSKSFPALVKYEEVKKEFGFSNSAFLDFSTTRKAGFSRLELCQFHKFLESQVKTILEVTRVRSAFDIRNPEFKAPASLWYPKILNLSCSHEKQVENDLVSLEAIELSPWHGILTAHIGSNLGAEVDFQDTKNGSKFGRFDPLPVQTLKDSYLKFIEETNLKNKRQFSENETLKGQVTGVAAWHLAFLEGLQADQVLNVFALILLTLGTRALFGRWRGAGLLLCSLFTMGLMLFGLMGLFEQPIDMLSNSLFLIVTVSAVQDFLYVSQSQLENPLLPWHEHFRSLLVPSFFTSLTTVFGFGSLMISDVESIQRFGLWAAVGAMLEWACTFFLLPAILGVSEKLRIWTFADKTLKFVSPKNLCRLAKISAPRRFVVFVTLVTFMAAPIAFKYLNVSDVAKETFSQNHWYRKTLDALSESRGWETSVMLWIRKDPDESKMYALSKLFEKHPDVMASESQQKSSDYLLDKKSSGMKIETQNLIAREIDIFGFHGSTKSQKGNHLSTLYLKNSSLETIQNLKNLSDKHCGQGQCALVGEMTSFSEFSDKVITTLLDSLTLSAFLVSIVLAFLCFAKSEKNVWPILLSSFWGICIMLILVSALQTRVNFVTCVFLCVLIGLAGDNAIQYLLAPNSRNLEDGIKARSLGSVQITLLASLTALVFLFSAFHPPKILGLLFSVGLIAVLVGDLWILRSLLPVLKPLQKVD
jgi:uncharacterized protein